MNLVEQLRVLTSGTEMNAERGYLGMSMIGDSCSRKLQYSMYLVKPESEISDRIARLFADGHAFEHKICKILEGIGFPVTGRQISLKCENDFWSGHIDGLLEHEGKVYLVEMKTHNDKNFKNVVKMGVKKGKPVHYDQMQMYMGHGGWTHCIYIAYNKNDSDIDFQEVEFDAAHFEKLKTKSVDIIATDVLLPRIGNNSPTWYECKFCNVSDVCFGNEAPDKNCRTCTYCEPHNGNVWSCNHHMIVDMPLESQLKGCPEHQLREMFK